MYNRGYLRNFSNYDFMVFSMIEKILSVTREELNGIDLSEFTGVQHWFNLEAGQEHYRLLAYISTLFNNSILLDIGTYKGDSARALSYGDNNVISFDLADDDLSFNGVDFRIGNILDHPDLILYSPFILLDTFHNGDFEQEFMDKLIEIDYHGLIMFDDIYLNDPMGEFWRGVIHEKYDITHIGHHTGTGIVKL